MRYALREAERARRHVEAHGFISPKERAVSSASIDEILNFWFGELSRKD
jgi:hypothetical protein